MSAIREWVEDGGTLVGVASAAAFLADSSSAFSHVRLRRQAVEENPSPQRGVRWDAARELHLSEAMGLEDEGSARPAPPGNFGVPGPGDPLVGPGALSFAPDFAKRAKAAPEAKEDGETKEGDEPDAETLARIDERLRRFHPRGAILRIDLDRRRWLAFGMPEKAPAFFYSSYAYLATDPVETVARFADYDVLQVSGLLWPEAAGRWARTAYATREARGRGQVVLLAGDPLFRGYWLGTRRLIQNAAILGPGMGASTATVY